MITLADEILGAVPLRPLRVTKRTVYNLGMADPATKAEMEKQAFLESRRIYNAGWRKRNPERVKAMRQRAEA